MQQETSPREKARQRRLIGPLALGGSILLQSAATVASKQAGLSSAGADLVSTVLNPWYGLSLMAMALQAVVWMIVLRHYRLSVAYPITSLIFGLHLLWAWLLFGETIELHHLLGILFIVGGVALVGRDAT